MLVMHVAYVSGADVAVDHEHDQVRQVPSHFNALDQAVSRCELAPGSQKYEPLISSE